MEKPTINKGIKALTLLLIITLSFSCIPVLTLAEKNNDYNSAELFPYFNGWLRTMEEGTPYVIKTSASIHELLPFTDETVASLDRLVSHMKADLYLNQQAQGLHWETGLYMDENPLLYIGGFNEENRLTQWTNIHSTAALSSTKTAPLYELLDITSSFEQTDMVQFPSFEKMQATIPDLLKHIAVTKEEKKSSSEFKKIAKSARMEIYNFDQDSVLQLQTFLSDCIQAADWMWGEQQNNQLIYENKGNLKVYYTKADELLGIEFSAQVLLNNELRDLEGMWAGNNLINQFKFSLPAQKGKNLVSLEGEVGINPEKGEMKINGKHKLRDEQGTVEKKLEGTLCSASAENNERITGDISLTTTNGEQVEILKITPSIVTSKLDTLPYEMKGSLRITRQYNKKIQSDITVSLVGQYVNEEKPNYSASAQDFDILSDTEKQNLSDLLSLSFTSAFAKAVFTLPQEEILFITESLSAENLEIILDLLK